MQGVALPDVYEGTTWQGMGQIALTDRTTNKPMSLAGATVNMIYRKGRHIALSLAVGNGISILSEVEGKMRVNPQILPLNAALYYFELFVTFRDGTKLLILLGTQRVSRLGVPS